MKTIKNTKKGAAERSADSYIKQVETAVATSKLDGEDVPDGTYEIDGEGNLTVPSLKDGKLKIEVSGNKPKSGTVTITNGQVTSTSEMDMGEYVVSYDKENNKYETTEKESTTPDTPTVVYRWSTDEINIGDTINPNDTSKYTKDPSTLGKTYYLKHVLDKDNKVTESYVCAIFNSREYCLRGGDSSFFGWAENLEDNTGDEENHTGNVLVIKNLSEEGIEGLSCSKDFTLYNNFECKSDSILFGADPDNSLYVVEGVVSGCYVDPYNVSSYCMNY